MIHINKTPFTNIKDIYGISEYDNAEDAMRGLCYRLRLEWDKIVKIKFSMMIFTGNIHEGYPQKFKKLILKEKLGSVINTGAKVNPNSGNTIRAYIWNVDKQKLSKWFKENRNKEEEDNA